MIPDVTTTVPEEIEKFLHQEATSCKLDDLYAFKCGMYSAMYQNLWYEYQKLKRELEVTKITLNNYIIEYNIQ